MSLIIWSVLYRRFNCIQCTCLPLWIVVASLCPAFTALCTRLYSTRRASRLVVLSTLTGDSAAKLIPLPPCAPFWGETFGLGMVTEDLAAMASWKINHCSSRSSSSLPTLYTRILCITKLYIGYFVFRYCCNVIETHCYIC